MYSAFYVTVSCSSSKDMISLNFGLRFGEVVYILIIIISGMLSASNNKLHLQITKTFALGLSCGCSRQVYLAVV